MQTLKFRHDYTNLFTPYSQYWFLNVTYNKLVSYLKKF